MKSEAFSMVFPFLSWLTCTHISTDTGDTIIEGEDFFLAPMCRFWEQMSFPNMQPLGCFCRKSLWWDTNLWSTLLRPSKVSLKFQQQSIVSTSLSSRKPELHSLYNVQISDLCAGLSLRHYPYPGAIIACYICQCYL